MILREDYEKFISGFSTLTLSRFRNFTLENNKNAMYHMREYEILISELTIKTVYVPEIGVNVDYFLLIEYQTILLGTKRITGN